jgi:hypothetical protein
MDQEEKQRNYERAELLLSEQNFVAALVAGVVATVLAAAIFGVITAEWRFSYGFAVAGIGVAVGIPMQYLGRGIRTKFAVAAALLTIAGCALGNVFTVLMLPTGLGATSPLDVLLDNPIAMIAKWSVSSVSFAGFFFWFIAVFAAAFLAMRPLSRADRLAIGLYDIKP